MQQQHRHRHQHQHQQQHSTGGRQAGRDDRMVHWVLVSSEHLVVKVVVKAVVVWWSGRLVRHRHRHRAGTGGTRRAGMAAAWDATRAFRPLRLGAWGPRGLVAAKTNKNTTAHDHDGFSKRQHA
jgi:hypothetical protein